MKHNSWGYSSLKHMTSIAKPKRGTQKCCNYQTGSVVKWKVGIVITSTPWIICGQNKISERSEVNGKYQGHEELLHEVPAFQPVKFHYMEKGKLEQSYPTVN